MTGLWGRLRNVLLAIFASFGLGILLARSLGSGLDYILLVVALGAVSGGCSAGAVGRSDLLRTVLCGIGLGLAVALTVWRTDLWGGVYGLAWAAAVLFGVLMGSYGLSIPVAVCALGTLMAGMFLNDGLRPVTLALLIASAGLTLDGFRERSLRRGLLQNDPDQLAHGPMGFWRNSLGMTAIFLVGAILLAVVVYFLGKLLLFGGKILLAWLSGGASAAYNKIAPVLERFRSWILSHFNNYQPEGNGPSGGTRNVEPLPGIVVVGSVLLLVLTIIGGAGILVGLLAVVWRFHGKRPKKLRTVQTQDYVDQVEDLDRPKLRFRWPWRKEKISDYAGAMQVRFAFRHLLKLRLKQDPLAYAKTPNQLRRQEDGDENRLIEVYNRVRYAHQPVTAADLELAQRFVAKNRQA